MDYVKLHRGERKFLVNFSHVTWVEPSPGGTGSVVNFGGAESVLVDETLAEIEELVTARK
jgi:hypothetical protein